MMNDDKILSIVIEVSERLARYEAVQEEQTADHSKLADEMAQHMRTEDKTLGRVFKELREIKERMEDVPNETHNQDHAYMEQMRKRDQARTEFWGAVKLKVTSGGAMALLGVAGSVIWFSIKVYFGADAPAE